MPNSKTCSHKTTFLEPPSARQHFGLPWELESPSDKYARKATLLHYWSNPGGKALVALSCCGAMLPPSRVYLAKITDPDNTEQWLRELHGPPESGEGLLTPATLSGLNHLFADIWLLADKGWRDGAAQLTGDDALWNQFVAHLRIHVAEHPIRHVRLLQVVSKRWPIARKNLMSSIICVCTLLCSYRRPAAGGVDCVLVGQDGVNHEVH
eukprot:1504911-Pleurochrysis_carterae.AAC.3